MDELWSAFDSIGRPYVQLVEAWAAEILRFLTETPLALEDDSDVWGVYDWVAACSTRDAIGALIDINPESRHAAVDVTDTLFESFTALVGGTWIEFVGVEPGLGWWWSRIPNTGPVREELIQMGWTPH